MKCHQHQTEVGQCYDMHQAPPRAVEHTDAEKLHRDRQQEHGFAPPEPLGALKVCGPPPTAEAVAFTLNRPRVISNPVMVTCDRCRGRFTFEGVDLFWVSGGFDSDAGFPLHRCRATNGNGNHP